MGKLLIVILSAGAFFLCLILSGCSDSGKEISFEQVLKESRETGLYGENAAESSSPEDTDVCDGTGKAQETGTQRHPEKNGSLIYVDVTGAVKEPGVVTLSEGARVYEAIAEAGGFSDDAAVELVNQAALLSDGQQIRVYTCEEAAQGAVSVVEEQGTKETAQGKININQAGAEELMTLPGIGESKAADIIRYREENGGFERIEDIMNISGIKESVFSKIKDKIVIQ